MNDQSRYIVDSRYFDGTCLTFMTDGFRSDFGGETLEEMHVALAVACVSAAFSKRYRYVWCSMALLIMFISFLCHKDML